MKTFQRLIYKQVVSTVLFVEIGFLGLFVFFDLIEELRQVGSSYQAQHAFAYVAMMVPNHFHELLPIAVLIGTIFVMSRMAQTSEFTILRTSGLGPVLALRNLIGLGFAFALCTFIVGDYLAPLSERHAQLMKSRYMGQITVGMTGAWLKERQSYSNHAVNIAAMDGNGVMRKVRIFEFNNLGKLQTVTRAERASFTPADDAWILQKIMRDEFTQDPNYPTPSNRIEADILRWPTTITQEMVSVALLRPDRMGTLDLFQYIRHLEANAQTAQRYEIEFWRKVFYPLSCLVMVVLALPFAYLHFRSGNIATQVFVGVLVGISYFLLNNVFGFMGTINQWIPWLAAAIPGLIYTALSLSIFGWLVLRH
jgi:lipopolysaccharide export system permease protein